MIYMNAMESNMIIRLIKQYEMVNFGKLTGYDFYHLEHYHPWAVRRTSIHRKVNPHLPFSQPDTLRANTETWGLRDYPLEHLRAINTNTNKSIVRDGRTDLQLFLLLLLKVAPQTVF